jgi:hypothetical protein
LRALGSGEPVAMSEREDHEGLADELERESDKLSQRTKELGEEIGDVRDDWERKRADEGVPGAPPRLDEDEDKDKDKDKDTGEHKPEDEPADEDG